MRIANDPAQTRSAGSGLVTAGSELLCAAGAAHLGSGAGGDATPRTDAALGMLASDWSSSLHTLSRQVEALGEYANLVATAFDRAGG